MKYTNNSIFIGQKQKLHLRLSTLDVGRWTLNQQIDRGRYRAVMLKFQWVSGILVYAVMPVNQRKFIFSPDSSAHSA